jgi:hypothetical protein
MITSQYAMKTVRIEEAVATGPATEPRPHAVSSSLGGSILFSEGPSALLDPVMGASGVDRTSSRDATAGLEAGEDARRENHRELQAEHDDDRPLAAEIAVRRGSGVVCEIGQSTAASCSPRHEARMLVIQVRASASASMMTTWPSSAKRSAIALPIPRPPPVTT